jgi:hypothetical protein
MAHLSEATMRRSVDEALALGARDRQHLGLCSRCAARLDAIEVDAQYAASLLSTREPEVDSAQAFRSIQTQMKREPGARTTWFRLTARARPRSHVSVLASGAFAALVAAIMAIGLTPAGSIAQSFINLFEPQQVATVQLSAADLRSLSQLRYFGMVKVPGSLSPQHVADAQAASVASGMHVLSPSFRPRGTPNAASYEVLGGGTGSFTFSTSRSKAWAAAHHTQLPPVPAGLDGSTLSVTTGDTVLATYSAGSGSLPDLVVGQTRAPRIATTGASVHDIEAYVLSLPGLSSTLRSQIQSLGNPISVLVLPVPADFATSHPVTVDGAHGYAISDSTGLGSVVIWEKDGVIYGVGGTLSESDALQTANSLG